MKAIMYQVIFLAIFTLFISVYPGFAVPAAPGLKTFVQPDGTSFLAHLKGDEYFHWIESSDNVVIVKNRKTAYYEYAVIKIIKGEQQLAPSGLIFNGINHDRKSASKISPVSRSELRQLWKKARAKRKQQRKK
jgi:hypothetical protein